MLKFGHCPLVSTYLLLNTSEVTFLFQHIQWGFGRGKADSAKVLFFSSIFFGEHPLWDIPYKTGF